MGIYLVFILEDDSIKVSRAFFNKTEANKYIDDLAFKGILAYLAETELG